MECGWCSAKLFKTSHRMVIPNVRAGRRMAAIVPWPDRVGLFQSWEARCVNSMAVFNYSLSFLFRGRNAWQLSLASRRGMDRPPAGADCAGMVLAGRPALRSGTLTSIHAWVDLFVEGAPFFLLLLFCFILVAGGSLTKEGHKENRLLFFGIRTARPRWCVRCFLRHARNVTMLRYILPKAMEKARLQPVH